jgi:hypothetical protein
MSDTITVQKSARRTNNGQSCCQRAEGTIRVLLVGSSRAKLSANWPLNGLLLIQRLAEGERNRNQEKVVFVIWTIR